MESTSSKDLPKKFLYLGLLIDETENTIIQLIISYLKIFTEKFTEVLDAKKLLESLENNNFEDKEIYSQPWKYPKESKQWHITTLFKNSKSVFSHAAYLNFKEGESTLVEIRGMVYIPSKIITSIIYTETPTQNEFPHLTTLIGLYKPKNSNDVLKEIFKADNMLNEYKEMMRKNYKIEDDEDYEETIVKIKLNLFDKVEKAYFLWFKTPVIFNTKMHVFQN